MKRSRFTEEQIIGMLKEQEAGMATADVCRKHGVSTATFYKYKARFGGLEVSDARRLRTLEDENGNGKPRDQPSPRLHGRDNPAAADAASRDVGVNAIHSLGRCRLVSDCPIQSTRRNHFARRFESKLRPQATSASSNSQLSLLNFPVSG